MAGTVTRLTAILQMNNTKFKQGLSGSQKALQGFQRQVKQLGGMIAGAFAVGSIVNFGREAIDLASKMEGVSTAFSRFSNSAQLLEDLRVATRGTVSDFELMQKTVEANNLKIPLTEMAKLFQFATNRAIETGKSVDYLVEQLVLGIGRKSVQRLDDLGLSLAEIQQEVKLVGDFGKAVGNIVDRELKKMGDIASTTATDTERLKTSWKNFKIALGGGAIKLMSDVAYGIREIGSAARFASGHLDDFESMAGNINQGIIRALPLLGTYKVKWDQTAAAIESAKRKAEEANRIFDGGMLPGVTVTGKKTKPRPSGLAGLPQTIESIDVLKEFEYTIPSFVNKVNDLNTAYTNLDLAIAQYGDDVEEVAGEAHDELLESLEKTRAASQKLTESLKEMSSEIANTFVHAVGSFAANANDLKAELFDIGKMINDSVADIMIAAGMKTGAWPLVVAGLAMKVGSGSANRRRNELQTKWDESINAFHESIGVDRYGNPIRKRKEDKDYTFTISGKDLVTVLDRNQSVP